MARDGVAVDSRLAAAVAARARGDAFNVAEVCRELQVSRKTFYKYLGRFRAEGVEGLFPRSRRARRQPSATPEATCEEIVRARKELAEEGQYDGAISIGWRLEEQGIEPVPARATIHRVLVRRGQVVPAPRKRPRRDRWHRFEAPFPNAMWQLDGFGYPLADGTPATVLQLLDDHSRMDVGCRAAPSENGADACATFQDAASCYGLPRALLTDNNACLNGSRRGCTAELEAMVRELGVTPVASSVGHPQTCGKDERAHSTCQRWLQRQDPQPSTIAELQALLAVYRGWYNGKRRHQGIGGLTPQQRWDLAQKSGPDATPISPPPLITRPRVSAAGAIGVDGFEIGLGRRNANSQATVFRTGDHVTVFIGTRHIRTLTLDRSRHYQPTGEPTGRPPRQPASAPSTKDRVKVERPQRSEDERP